MMKKINKKGFSLMEVIFYMVLVGILIGIAVPNLGKFKEKAELTIIKADSKTVRDVALLENLTNKNLESFNLLTELTGKTYLNGNEISEIPKGGAFYEISKDEVEQSNTTLMGRFYRDDRFNIIYIDELNNADSTTKESNKYLAKDSDFEFVPSILDGRHKYMYNGELTSGYYKYTGNKDIVEIPTHINGEKLLGYTKMFEDANLKKVIANDPEVVSAEYMFYNAKSDNLDMSELSIPNLENAVGMFSGLKFDILRVNFDAKKIKDYTNFFKGAKGNKIEISNTNRGNADRANYMLSNIEVGDISGLEYLNLQSINRAIGLLEGSTIESIDLSSIDISNIISHNMLKDSNIKNIFVRNSEDLDFVKSLVGDNVKVSIKK